MLQPGLCKDKVVQMRRRHTREVWQRVADMWICWGTHAVSALSRHVKKLGYPCSIGSQKVCGNAGYPCNISSQQACGNAGVPLYISSQQACGNVGAPLQYQLSAGAMSAVL